jgi:hypothetical protein
LAWKPEAENCFVGTHLVANTQQEPQMCELAVQQFQRQRKRMKQRQSFVEETVYQRNTLLELLRQKAVLLVARQTVELLVAQQTAVQTLLLVAPFV